MVKHEPPDLLPYGAPPTSGGLLLRGVEQARAIDPGFRLDGLTIAKIELPEAAWDIPRATAVLADLTDGLRAAAVGSFGFTTAEPFGERSTWAGIRLPGEDAARTHSHGQPRRCRAAALPAAAACSCR